MSVATASADVVVAVDGTWIPFDFGDVGSFAESDPPPPWIFSGPARVTVLDLFLIGDRFNLYDNNLLVGPTSIPGTGSCDDVLACLADPNASIGVFALGAGNHSLTIETIASPFGFGGAVLQVSPVSAVPEPSTIMLFGLGLVGLGVARRRWAPRKSD